MEIAEYVWLPRQKVISAGKVTIALPLRSAKKEIGLAVVIFHMMTLKLYPLPGEAE